MNDRHPAGEYERCGGKTRGGGTCKLPAGHHTSHPGVGRCDHHGGATPTHVQNARERQAEAAARTYGLPVRTTAHQALQDELARSNGIIGWLLTRIAALPEEDLTWGTEKQVVRTGTGEGGQRQGAPQIERTLAAKPHIYLTLLERERRHHAMVAADMARIGIEERAVRVDEATAAMLGRVIDAVLADANLDEAQREAAMASLPRRIRELTAA